jgi:hypothetical protein
LGYELKEVEKVRIFLHLLASTFKARPFSSTLSAFTGFNGLLQAVMKECQESTSKTSSKHKKCDVRPKSESSAILAEVWLSVL